MSILKPLRAAQRALARQGLYVFFALFRPLPYRLVRLIGQVLIAVGYVFIWRQKKIARESLTIAFSGEKSAAEIENIARECFYNFGWGMVEMLYAMAHPHWALGKVTIDGRDRLDTALARGQGVITVTAHFGNFPLMMLALAQMGYDVSSIIRPARDADLEKFLYRKRSDLSVKTVYAIPRRECVEQSLKVLRTNGLLFIPIDQHFGNGHGVWVDFFGRKAATATGPAVFSLRTGAPIIPVFVTRQGVDGHRIIVEAPIPVAAGADEEERVLETTAAITRVIEQYIRRYPQEWGWMHRRWKT
ncbi:MAG: lysophospholipid acyltransferase family protein [Candidatus Omnitrophica bacterium]|nr:lysophospholipid acyltransferase family protein [Candidatus Omnitrophota bacterium]